MKRVQFLSQPKPKITSSVQAPPPQTSNASLIQRDPQTLSPAEILQLQRTHGNQFVRRLLGQETPTPAESFAEFQQRLNIPVQAKLTVTPAGDQYKREADAMSQQVMQTMRVQRQPEDDDMQLQRYTDFTQGGTVNSNVENQIKNARGSGQPLPDNVRSPMENAFGVDFSSVRVHTDSTSDTLNRSVQAKAFTTGSDIFFTSGMYNPYSHSGQELLTHELTHVVQQAPASQRMVQRSLSKTTQTTNFFGKEYDLYYDSFLNEYVIIENERTLPNDAKVLRLANPTTQETWYYHTGTKEHTRRNPVPNNNPKLTGLEIEIASAKIKSKTDDPGSNGIILAKTEETRNGFPLFKLETEGYDRNDPCIELVTAPLELEEFEGFNIAEEKFIKALDNFKGNASPIDALVKSFNSLLNEELEDYTLVSQTEDFTIRYQPTHKTIVNMNIQTNVSVPYNKMGLPEDNLLVLFDLKADQKAYTSAVEDANKIIQQIPSDSANLTSLFTHIIFNEFKFFYHNIEKNNVKKVDKHHFHMMMKFSPEDVIMNILNDSESILLVSLLSDTLPSELQTAIVKAITASGKAGRNFKPTVDYNHLKKVAELRVKHGAQPLKSVEEDAEKSPVYDKDEKEVGSIKHTHPRPTNRIPIKISGDTFYVVIEQRYSKHLLNSSIMDQKKLGFITQLQQ